MAALKGGQAVDLSGLPPPPGESEGSWKVPGGHLVMPEGLNVVGKVFSSFFRGLHSQWSSSVFPCSVSSLTPTSSITPPCLLPVVGEVGSRFYSVLPQIIQVQVHEVSMY